MKGRWGRRVYGFVRKGEKNTQIYLEYELANGVRVYETELVPNDALDRHPTFYGFVLNRILEQLEKRIADRAQ